jgi:NAD(P)H dehydrogenase (quinone)
MIVVTAATGKLGSSVVDGLLAREPVDQIAVAVRNPEKATSLAARGIEVRHADYDKPQTLERAFRSGDKVLLISSSEISLRVKQHKAVVAAAKRAGAALIAYTSILHGEHNKIQMAEAHVATERAIRASEVPFVFLRNGWYLENYTEETLRSALESGAFFGCAENGRIAAAARADYAEAAAAVLTTPRQEGKTYELAGDAAFTMSDLAAEVSRQSGKPVVYKDLPAHQYAATLVRFGVPEAYAALLADSDAGIARGELDDKTGALRRLIGRPTTMLSEAVRTGLARAHMAVG